MLDALRALRWWRPISLVRRTAPPLLGLVLLSGLVLVQPGNAQPPSSSSDPLTGSSPHTRINRQIDLFERVVDDVLIESDYALVRGGRNAIGAYLPGYGAVIAIEFSLVGRDYWDLRLGSRGLRLWSGRGHDVFFYDDDDDDDDDEDYRDWQKKRRLERLEDDDDYDNDDDDRYRRSKKTTLEFLTKQYGRVKKELIETLGDYGDLLDAIPADEWVVLTARAMDRPWGKERISTLVIRVRRSDLTARVEDRIDDDTLRGRVVIEEYK